MKIDLIKINNNLVPSLPDDEEKIAKWPRGTICQVDYKRPRNAAFNRKFHALIHVVFVNQEKYRNKEDLLIEIKLKCGHYQEHITTKGKVIYIPKSISFASMDDVEFSMFYSKAIDVILADFMPVEPEELDRMVEEVLRFA